MFFVFMGEEFDVVCDVIFGGVDGCEYGGVVVSV